MEKYFDLSKPVAIGSDHAGYKLKELIISYLEGRDLKFKDFGTDSTDASDYPDVAHPVAKAMESGAYSFGILLCGSGNGMGITANKHPSVRAAVCWDEEIAALARKHNNANVICIPARFVSEQVAETMINVFTSNWFEEGRHTQRVGKIPPL